MLSQTDRVGFNPIKKSARVFHKRFCAGNDLKILGVTFDTVSLARAAACEVATEARSILHAVLKVQRFFNLLEIFVMRKSQILSYIEDRTPGLQRRAFSFG